MGKSPDVRIQAELFDTAHELRLLIGDRRDLGGVVTFTGLCRDENGKLSALELEHYPGMAETEIRRIAQQAFTRWPVEALTAIHRFGKILPSEPIVFVGAASIHREAAFNAASFVMDFLKNQAPFWKREWLASGEVGDWVESRDSDLHAQTRWDNETDTGTLGSTSVGT